MEANPSFLPSEPKFVKAYETIINVKYHKSFIWLLNVYIPLAKEELEFLPYVQYQKLI